MRTYLFSILIIGLFAGGCSNRKNSAPDYVDVAVLLEKMTNLNTFAENPIGLSFMESSYDRTGGNQDWVVYTRANTLPNGRIKLFEAIGPGYISRFWIASFDASRWLFFFDGESEPRLNLSKDELFGEKFPFLPPLAGQSGGGRYCLFPIPFSKSIRIEVIPKDLNPANRNYFQINYTRLNMNSADVESFPAAWSADQSNLVEVVNNTLDVQCQEQSELISLCLTDAQPQTIQPGESLPFWNDTDKGVLKTICIRIDSPTDAAAIYAELLRQLRLKMIWDGTSFPSVDVPLGDFFCNPFYFRSYASMPLGRGVEIHLFAGFRCRIKTEHFVFLKIIRKSRFPFQFPLREIATVLKGCHENSMPDGGHPLFPVHRSEC